MTVKNAKDFIQTVRQDSTLRKKLNSAGSRQAIEDIISEAGFPFTREEYVEAYSYILANTPNPEATEEIREFNQWWEILNNQ